MASDNDRKGELTQRILELVYGGDGVSFYQILKELEMKSGEDISFARDVVTDMVKGHLIEERYFADGRVDYVMDADGMELLEKLRGR